jgi:2-methylcitrate dehydratase PrpD
LKGAATSGLSALLATHIADSQFERLPPATVTATKRAILDGFGVMLAASGCSDDVLPFLALARAFGGPPQASIIGCRERVSPPMAAFANGSMAHALDFEDAFDPAPVHPNASLLPAAIAIAEATAAVSGRDLIVAVATGCDLVCRLGLSLDQPMEQGGWYPPPILGAYGAVAAAGRLLRLTPRQICDAFSLLMCQNTCPGEIKHSPDTVIRAVREAFPAQAAVISTLLAARGVRGFEEPLEGASGFFALYVAGRYDAATIRDQLGERYWIEQLSFKRWPSCRGTHAYIEAAQVLRRRHGFGANDVARIRATIGTVQRMLCEPPARKRAPQTAIDAKFSVPFTLAAALLHEEVTLESFTPAALRDPQLLALAAKVESELREDWGHEHAASAELTLHLNDGRLLQHVVPHALGDPKRPLDDATLRDKFIDCAARAATPLTGVAAARAADRILSLVQEAQAAAAFAVYD